jgi:hypothetical protein
MSRLACAHAHMVTPWWLGHRPPPHTDAVGRPLPPTAHVRRVMTLSPAAARRRREESFASLRSLSTLRCTPLLFAPQPLHRTAPSPVIRHRAAATRVMTATPLVPPHPQASATSKRQPGASRPTSSSPVSSHWCRPSSATLRFGCCCQALCPSAKKTYEPSNSPDDLFSGLAPMAPHRRLPSPTHGRPVSFHPPHCPKSSSPSPRVTLAAAPTHLIVGPTGIGRWHRLGAMGNDLPCFWLVGCQPKSWTALSRARVEDKVGLAHSYSSLSHFAFRLI